MGNNKCKYEKCDRNTWENDQYCVFHSKDKESKKEGFNEIFWDEFKRQKKEKKINDFRGFIFPDDINFNSKEFEKDVFFSYSKFHGEVKFLDAKFFGKAEFVSVDYFDRANFSRTEYYKEANFSLSRFSKFADFTLAKFCKKDSTLNEDVSSKEKIITFFKGNQFHGRASFNSAQFGETTEITDNSLNEVNFNNVTFYKDAFFEGTKFFQKLEIREAKFLERAKFKKAEFLDIADFTKSSFEGKTGFKCAQFREISKLYMNETYFNDVYNLIEILNNEFKQGNIKVIKYLKFKLTQFLTNNIKIILGDRSSARRPIESRQIKDDWFLIRYGEKHKVVFFLWWLFADCGRSFLRWAFWSMMFAFGFACKFIYSYSADPNSFIFYDKPESIITFIYYSVVTFTTLGFGDVLPATEPLKVWVMAEVILGYIMLGGLISILANKLARRND